MKESITKFDLEAAFKALDEIDIPVAEKGIKANKPALTEIFSRKSKFDSLFEEYYDIGNTAELSDAKEAREAEVAKAKLARIEKIVDLDADSPEDLLTSYVGKFIIQCPQCMTLFYKSPEDVEESEDDATIVNVNEVCQHCGNESGYTLIGKVGEATPDEAAEESNELEPTEDGELSAETETDVDDTEAETSEDGTEEEFDLDSELDELDLDIEDDEAEEEKKEEAFSTNTEGNYLLEQLTEDADVETSAEDFEKLINSPEFKKPISDNTARAMMQEFSDTDEEKSVEEDLKEALEEGIFDSKEKKQKTYAELVKKVFEKDINIVANEAVINADNLIKEVADGLPDDKDQSTRLAKGVISLINNAKQAINKTPHSLIKNIIAIGQKYERESLNLEELVGFMKKVGKLQSVDKAGYKAMEFLFEKINKALDVKLAQTIKFLKNEYKIIESIDINIEEPLEEGIFDKLKDKLANVVDNVTSKLKSREGKADWIRENAMEDYNNIKTDNTGKLIPDEKNQRFKTFVVIGYEEKYTNGKLITTAPSFNNKDLKIGKNGVQNKKNYKDADNIAKGWSMRQGNGPAFIYLAKDVDDDKAVFLCEYFKGELENDQLEKYFDIVKKDLKAGKLMAKGGMENTDDSDEKANVETTNNDEVKDSSKVTDTVAEDNEDILQLKTESLDTIMSSIEELQEASLENFISSSLVENYKNVAGFRLTSCDYLEENLKVNGTIYFTSGNTRKTTYAFSKAYTNKNGKIILHGLNEKLGLDKQFTIIGQEINKTFITESFNFTHK